MRTLIRDVTVFDGERTTAHVTVELTNGLITSVRPERAGATDARSAAPADTPTAAPAGTPATAPGADAVDEDAVDGAVEEVDGRGKTLLPGLIDAHTHVFDGSLSQALRYGVTTELDMFCLPHVLPGQRRLAADRDDVADLRSAGTLATVPGGHPTQLLPHLPGVPDGPVAIDVIDDPARATEFVRARQAEGADYLKIVIDDGSVHGTDLPAMTPELATALTSAAHAVGLRVIAHAITGAEVVTALDAGVDGLAHVWTDLAPGDPASRRLAERVRSAGVFTVTTLAYFEAITERGSRAPVCARPGSLGNAVGAVRALREAGAPLLAGTDATPYDPGHGSGMHRELLLLRRAGLSPRAALAAATSLPARHFALTDRGRIAPGLRADLVLVEGDPTRDIATITALTDVWRRGVRHAHPAP
ncbi:amidohydrolase family protein [Streptomyces sp. 71268]|uniref:amidohydrolase family protein n=1 Tax=Streptomyces sp. 71268 TaxID=3002640 RepID=UPI0023F72EFF|nr:amidohydrolase family protein [Streptomyces sp. 71268]WEV26171.1 amidohydrolase family protein [Streptomyces sp. 71268]